MRCSFKVREMMRIVLGIIIGFVVWSIVWVGSESTLASISPDWLGLYSQGVERAIFNKEPFEYDNAIAAINLLRSVITSIIAGYMCALAAGEYRRSTTALGLLLIVVGIVVEAYLWAYAPVWYHIGFILLLLPAVVLGGRLRRSS